MENELTLSEKLLLLAIRPGKGGLLGFSSQILDFTLVGAILLELELEGKISIVDKKVNVLSHSGHAPLFDYVLDKLNKSKRPRRIGHWLEPFYISKRKIRSFLNQSLEQKREIKLEERHFLFFRWKKPFLGPGNHAYNLISKVKSTVIQSPENVQDMYLLVLLDTAELWPRIYSERSMRKSAKKKVRTLLEKSYISEELNQASITLKVIRRAINDAAAAARAAAT